MRWQLIKSEQDLSTLHEISKEKPVLIFKHSTTCPISSTALNRLERSWKEEEVPEVSIYFLDLLRFRNLSQAIAHKYGVDHESPQVLLIKSGNAVYSESHFGINFQDLKEQLN